MATAITPRKGTDGVQQFGLMTVEYFDLVQSGGGTGGTFKTKGRRPHSVTLTPTSASAAITNTVLGKGSVTVTTSANANGVLRVESRGGR